MGAEDAQETHENSDRSWFVFKSGCPCRSDNEATPEKSRPNIAMFEKAS